MYPAAARLGLVISLVLCARTAPAQQPFGVGRAEAGKPDPARCAEGAGKSGDGPALSGEIDQGVKALDSVSYRLLPASCFQVKTGKAGLLSFAGHSHLIQARAFRGQVVYYPKTPSSSHLEITVVTDSLEVLTPPDTAEIRKVTAAMRSDILKTAEHHEITLVSRRVTPTAGGFRVLAALTLVGQTREVPVEVAVLIGADTLRAAATFAIKQTDFGIKPFSGGPGGTVKVADRVTFDIHAIALRSSGTSP
jgi:polyisoprenoid-binding protein YceI